MFKINYGKLFDANALGVKREMNLVEANCFEKSFFVLFNANRQSFNQLTRQQFCQSLTSGFTRLEISRIFIKLEAEIFIFPLHSYSRLF